MSWHDKHEQDQDRKTDGAVQAAARSQGGCGRCTYARNFRQTTDGIKADCVMLRAVLTTVDIGYGQSCAHRKP